MTRPVWAADGRDAAVVACVADLVRRPRTKTLCLPGGSTPGPMLATLAALPLPWNTVTLLPGDERVVPPSHAASNVGALHRMFDATAAEIVPLALGMSLPALDLVWLGVGDDGHIASLFPGNDAVAAPAGVVAVIPDSLPASAPFARLTLTLRALAAAEQIIIVARGKAKRRVLDAAIAGADLPVARLFSLASATIYWSET